MVPGMEPPAVLDGPRVFSAGDLAGGRFEIEAHIASGGMGEVYRALDRKLQRRVALKVLPVHLSSRQDFRERLEREARATSSLNHPHICSLYDFGYDGATGYLVMEYLEGETLRDRMAAGDARLRRWLPSPARSRRRSKPLIRAISSIGTSSRRTSS